MHLLMSLTSFHITSLCNRYTLIYLLPQYQIPKHISGRKCWCPPVSKKTRARIRLFSADNSTYGTSDDHSRTADESGLTGKEGKGSEESLTLTEILKKLQRYGLSGMLSYGLLNTVYYTTAFLLVWFYISPAPGKMGFRAAAERFLKMMAVVWAGSQVTKLFRAGGALALAPFVDRGLSWFTVRFKFKSQGKAFLTIVSLCLGFAVILFFAVTLLSA